MAACKEPIIWQNLVAASSHILRSVASPIGQNSKRIRITVITAITVVTWKPSFIASSCQFNPQAPSLLPRLAPQPFGRRWFPPDEKEWESATRKCDHATIQPQKWLKNPGFMWFMSCLFVWIDLFNMPNVFHEPFWANCWCLHSQRCLDQDFRGWSDDTASTVES